MRLLFSAHSVTLRRLRLLDLVSQDSYNTTYTASLRYAQKPYGTSYIWDMLGEIVQQ